jgi:peptidoglycan hydrolase FlgJ
MSAINDIVLGVTKAADVAKREAAVARLEKLSAQAKAALATTEQTADAAATEWSTELQRAAADTSRTAKFVSTSDATAGATSKEKNVYVQFEALLLKNMVEAMMPKNSEAVFGHGIAGDLWKSMLAEKIAAEIARTGAVGIAKQVAASETAAVKKAGDA